MKLKTMYVVLLYYVAGFIVFSVKRKYRKKKILTNSLKVDKPDQQGRIDTTKCRILWFYQTH